MSSKNSPSKHVTSPDLEPAEISADLTTTETAVAQAGQAANELAAAVSREPRSCPPLRRGACRPISLVNSTILTSRR